jgi:hypothetical protein
LDVQKCHDASEKYARAIAPALRFVYIDVFQRSPDAQALPFSALARVTVSLGLGHQMMAPWLVEKDVGLHERVSASLRVLCEWTHADGNLASVVENAMIALKTSLDLDGDGRVQYDELETAVYIATLMSVLQ